MNKGDLLESFTVFGLTNPTVADCEQKLQKSNSYSAYEAGCFNWSSSLNLKEVDSNTR